MFVCILLAARAISPEETFIVAVGALLPVGFPANPATRAPGRRVRFGGGRRLDNDGASAHSVAEICSLRPLATAKDADARNKWANIRSIFAINQNPLLLPIFSSSRDVVAENKMRQIGQSMGVAAPWWEEPAGEWRLFLSSSARDLMPKINLYQRKGKQRHKQQESECLRSSL